MLFRSLLPELLSTTEDVPQTAATLRAAIRNSSEYGHYGFGDEILEWLLNRINVTAA